jgi:plastocyanin
MKIKLLLMVSLTIFATLFILPACQSNTVTASTTEAPTIAAATSASETTTTQAPAQGQGVTIMMQNKTFIPKSITVSVGTKVTWTNQDTFGHNVISGTSSAADAGSLFKSDNLNQGDSFSYTFNQVGTYPYFCSVHPGMDGTIIVQ